MFLVKLLLWYPKSMISTGKPCIESTAFNKKLAENVIERLLEEIFADVLISLILGLNAEPKSILSIVKLGPV